MTQCRTFYLLLLTSACSSGSVLLAESEADFFERRIRPILVDRCEVCHSAAKAKTSGGLALDTRGGMTFGATDDFGWHATENIVHVHDLHATILHLMGFDHERLTYRFGGRDYRLTDVHGHVVQDILA